MPAPPPNSDFLKSLPVLPIAVLHSLAPVSALKAVTTASVSTTTSRLSATTGAAPSRCVLVLPAMLALQIWLRDAASARWPIDFEALPPDCAQSALATAAGSTTAVSASAGSTLMLASFDRIDTRSPTVGVLGPPPPLNTPQPASGSAPSATANRHRLFRVLFGFLSCLVCRRLGRSPR